MHREVRECLQGADIDFLPQPDVWIGRKWLYEGGEITDAMDIKARQDLKAQLGKVHPL